MNDTSCTSKRHGTTSENESTDKVVVKEGFSRPLSVVLVSWWIYRSGFEFLFEIFCPSVGQRSSQQNVSATRVCSKRSYFFRMSSMESRIRLRPVIEFRMGRFPSRKRRTVSCLILWSRLPRVFNTYSMMMVAKSRV